MSRSPMAPRSDDRDLVAFLGGLCLFLSTIEYLVPKPVPFLRIGIANLPLLIGLDLLAPGQLMLVAALKVIGQGMVSGTLATYVFLFSAAGTFSSTLAMLAVRKLAGPRMSLVGVSVTGALLSNLAQIGLAIGLDLIGQGAWVIAPPFIAAGAVSSALLGWFAERFTRSSRWFASVRPGT
jgi:heptaprenyl diphosphate synthase